MLFKAVDLIIILSSSASINTIQLQRHASGAAPILQLDATYIHCKIVVCFTCLPPAGFLSSIYASGVFFSCEFKQV